MIEDEAEEYAEHAYELAPRELSCTDINEALYALVRNGRISSEDADAVRQELALEVYVDLVEVTDLDRVFDAGFETGFELGYRQGIQVEQMLAQLESGCSVSGCCGKHK